MDLSQHWETLVSIIVGIALADVLMHVQELIHARDRVRWDALPLLWTTIGVLWLFNYWWAVGVGLDGSQNVYVAGGFVLLAIPPILLFVMSTSALPRRVPDEGTIDMRAAWVRNRTVFLPALGLNQVAAWVATIVARGGVVFDFPAVLRTSALMLVIAMLFVKSRRLEWFAAVVILSLVIARLSTQLIR
jgi:hypothetical protein